MSFQKNYPELAALLYHGSTVGVNAIDLSLSARGKDFGRGFYTTGRRDQAIKFARLKAKRLGTQYGFVSVFQYTHNPELTIQKFDRADSEWLSFVLRNRGFVNNRRTVSELPFDVVIGPVANDAVGLVLNQLVIGTYGDPQSEEAQDTAIGLLNTAKLYSQVFFGTTAAISSLQFKEAFQVGIN